MARTAVRVSVDVLAKNLLAAHGTTNGFIHGWKLATENMAAALTLLRYI
jgi:hypothetical protein